MRGQEPTAPDAAAGDAAARLVERITAGDRAAEAELVERYSRPVTYLLRKLTGDPTLSDDLHQETFRVVLEKARAGEIRQPERLAGFVRSTARNLAIGEFRRRRRRAEGGDPELVEARPDPALDQQQRVERQEDRRRVRRLLGELRSERDRQVLYRFHLQQEDRSYAARLEAPGGGTPWQGEGLEPDLEGSLNVLVPSGFLVPGDYRLHVTGSSSGAEPVPVASVAFRVLDAP